MTIAEPAKNKTILQTRTSNTTALIIFISIILITTWTMSIIFSAYQYNLTIRQAEDQVFRMNQIVAEQTGNLFREIRSYLQVLDKWLQDNPKSDPRTDPGFIHLVEAIKKSGRIQFDIRLVSKNDGLFYIPSKDTVKPLAQVGDRDYVNAQKDPETRGFFIAKPVLSRVTKLWGIPVSYPITKQNAGISVIFAAIELPTLNALYETVRPKPNGAISLTTTNGIILDRVPFEAKYMGASTGFADKGPEIQNGVQTIISPLDGLEKIISFRTIEDMPLRVSISIPKNEVLSPWKYRMIILFGILTLMSALIIMIGFFLYKSWLRISESENKTKILNDELNKENIKLEDALSQVRQLSGMLPICASCKKIRNDEGYWEQIEQYIGTHSRAEFSHSLCPDCARNLYPGIFKNKK